MTILSCQQCGADFNCKPSRIAKGKGKFCSRECRTASTGGWTLKHPNEYAIYCHAKARCQNPNSPKRHRYQDRGIEFRFDSFAQFMAELGPRPKGAQLDRINNDGHYESGNVRWASQRVQSRNRECTWRITIGHETKTASEWAELNGLKYHTIWARVNTYGWSVEQAVTTPISPQTYVKRLCQQPP